MVSVCASLPSGATVVNCGASQCYTITPNFSGPDFTNTVGVYTGQATAISIDAVGSLYVSDQTGKTVSKEDQISAQLRTLLQRE